MGRVDALLLGDPDGAGARPGGAVGGGGGGDDLLDEEDGGARGAGVAEPAEHAEAVVVDPDVGGGADGVVERVEAGEGAPHGAVGELPVQQGGNREAGLGFAILAEARAARVSRVTGKWFWVGLSGAVVRRRSGGGVVGLALSQADLA